MLTKTISSPLNLLLNRVMVSTFALNCLSQNFLQSSISSSLLNAPSLVESLQVYRKHGISKELFNEVFQEAERQKIVEKAFKSFDQLKPKRSFIKKHRIRPCFTEALKSGEMAHGQRIALVYEAYCAGMSRDEIVGLYRCLDDFDEAKTRYQIDWLLNGKNEREIKPYRCVTIQKKGWCIGEKCPYFKGT